MSHIDRFIRMWRQAQVSRLHADVVGFNTRVHLAAAPDPASVLVSVSSDEPCFCLEDDADVQEKVRSPHCPHVAHRQCYERWLKSKDGNLCCPTCRVPVVIVRGLQPEGLLTELEPTDTMNGTVVLQYRVTFDDFERIVYLPVDAHLVRLFQLAWDRKLLFYRTPAGTIVENGVPIFYTPEDTLDGGRVFYFKESLSKLFVR